MRCLVCNNVTNQTRDTDIVHGGPQLVHTLRTLHRNGRSHSPPGDGSRSPRSPPTQQLPQQAGNTRPQHHARLAKMGAAPEVNYADETADDPDYIADFRYSSRPTTANAAVHSPQPPQQQPRLPAMSQTSAARFAAQQAMQAAAPLIQIISHHLPAGAAMHQVYHQQQQQQQQGQQQQQVVNYYKDLEQQLQVQQKGKQGQPIVRPADMSQRPRSAPSVKRPVGVGSANSAKLQPMMKDGGGGAAVGTVAVMSATVPAVPTLTP